MIETLQQMERRTSEQAKRQLWLVEKPRVKPLLVRVDRICAWCLVGSMFAYMITGFGMTKGIISPDLSKLIHDSMLPVPAFIAFAFHSAYGIHVALKRWKVWSPAWSAVLVVYVVTLVIGVFVFQYVLKGINTAVAVPTKIEL